MSADITAQQAESARPASDEATSDGEGGGADAAAFRVADNADDGAAEAE